MEQNSFYEILKDNIEDDCCYEINEKFKKLKTIINEEIEVCIYRIKYNYDNLEFYMINGDAFASVNITKTNMNIKLYRKQDISKIEINDDGNMEVSIYIEDQIFKMDTAESNRRFTKKTLQSWLYDFINLIKN